MVLPPGLPLPATVGQADAQGGGQVLHLLQGGGGGLAGGEQGEQGGEQGGWVGQGEGGGGGGGEER